MKSLYRLFFFTTLFVTIFCQAQKDTITTKFDDEIEALYKKGIQLIKIKNEFDKGLLILDSARTLAKADENMEQLVRVNYASATGYILKGDFDVALNLLKKGILMIDTMNIEGKQISYDSYVNHYQLIGYYYAYRSENVLAMKYYRKALFYAEKDPEMCLPKVNTLNQIAVLLIQQKSYDEAIHYFEQINDVYVNDYILKNIYTNLGVIYIKKEDPVKAKEYFLKTKSLMKEDKVGLDMLYVYIGLANVYYLERKWQRSLQYYQKSYVMANTLGTQKEIINIALGFSEVYSELGEFSKALPYLSIAENTIAKVSSGGETNLMTKNLYDVYSDVYEKAGNYKKSTIYLHKSIALSDSIFAIDKTREVERLKIQYETEKQAKEIEFLTLQREKKELEIQQKETALERSRLLKNVFLISFLIILIPVVGLLYVYFQKLITQKELSVKNEEISQQKITEILRTQQLKTIKATLQGQETERKRIAQELHDSIGGGLAGIKLQLDQYTKEDSTIKNTVSNLQEICEQVRDISHDLIPKKIVQNAFTTVISNHIKTIDSTSEVKINFLSNSEEAINNIDEQIQAELYKIIQELFTNMLKHAEASKVDLSLNYYDNTINLLFEDNGKGFNIYKKKSGIGLDNIESRIKALDGNLNIDSHIGRGTIINIDIPIV
ncbi:ATP-binding protein [Aquimarina megaterium]|uniref:ATP-binding protein n=1 Tax=Aquimarina megaterium TaxID=1443666 RepID=UPI0009421103|nr:ATP-binding protein [Aquimarina megaterium]